MLSKLDHSTLGDVQQQTIGLMMYHAGYGNLKSNTPSPGDDIRYYEGVRDFRHPWSLAHRAEEYAFYELKEVFGSLSDYLKLPPGVAAELCNGVRKGAERLAEEKRRRAASQTKTSEQRGLEQQLEDLAKLNLSSG